MTLDCGGPNERAAARGSMMTSDQLEQRLG
jgi:hypothetical protein